MQKSVTNSDHKIYSADASLEAKKGQQALQRYLDVNNISIDYYYLGTVHLLKKAVLDPDIDMLNSILLCNPNLLLVTKDKWQETAIHTASRLNSPKHLIPLLEAAKKRGQLFEALNSQDGRGNTPLAWACTNKEEATIDILLGYGADPTIPNQIAKRPIDFLTDRPKLAQKVQAHIEKQNQLRTSAPTAAVTKVNSPQSSAVKPALPHPVSGSPQESNNKPRFKFDFDQIDIRRARSEMKLSESGMIMYLKGFASYKPHGHQLLNPELPSFAKVYVVLEYLILSLDLERIFELEKILDDEAKLLWVSGFDSSKSRTFSNILQDIKLPAPIADQNDLSPATYAHSVLLPWFEQHRHYPAVLRNHVEDDFLKCIEALSKKSPCHAVVQLIKGKAERTYSACHKQSEAVKEYVNSKIQPPRLQQIQNPAIAIPTPPAPPKPVQRRNSMDKTQSAEHQSQDEALKQHKLNQEPVMSELLNIARSIAQAPPKPGQRRSSMDRTQSPTTFFGPARQKTPSPPQDGSLSGSPGSGEGSPKSLPNRTVLRRDVGLELIQACRAGDIALAKTLLDVHGANPNAVNEDNVTPLHSAAYIGNLPLVQLLVEHSASIDPVDNHLNTPLMLASGREHTQTSLYLLDNGANPYARCKNNRSPFESAILDNNLDEVNKIVSLGTDLNKPFYDTLTPLCLAALRNYLAMVKLFVEHGADLTHVATYKTMQFTAIEAAANAADTTGNREVLEYLEGLNHSNNTSVQLTHQKSLQSEESSRKCSIM